MSLGISNRFSLEALDEFYEGVYAACEKYGIDLVGGLTFRGLRVVEHTAVAPGDFLVFDQSKAAIFDRAGTTVRFYDQDQDNAIKNLITIVIEKRLALPIYQPNAFIKGTFATAITDLTT